MGAAARPWVRVLWELGDAVCACHTIAFVSHITVTIDGIVVEDAWFNDDILAGQFAADLRDVFQ
jgi:hypothetical protein